MLRVTTEYSKAVD